MAVFINTKNKGKTMKEIRSVICLNCRRTALVRLLPYGRGKVGVCPLCNGVAYNSGIRKKDKNTIKTPNLTK